ncbi:hypothetical protein BU23DRAFT_201750 [Bimuria novae-zelandiae CBS 107.79]|uniref:Extracellular membrane protein CFEM domain-containing protein n=1 Tax=Bimuria novae-zelandiae CBS 107.79 TaxID=1447943 RepID=A0A6A5V0H4_9PLEO|nr:hypothetical protein BU23DRAFT_201750 [Bimuria novae-zelandiae CBS 107.79]
MRSTTFFLPLAFAFATNAINISLGPDTVCGDNSVDCGNGFCCSSGSTCDTSGAVTKCGSDGTLAKPFNAGSIASAFQSKVSSLENLPASLVGQFSSIVHAIPTDIASSAQGFLSSVIANHDIPTGTELSQFIDSLPTSAQGAVNSALNSLEAEVNSALGNGPSSASGNGQPKNTQGGSGAAPAGSATFGNTAALVVGIWGAAAVGGVMLVL